MKVLAAIDPSINSSGLALFIDAVLVRAAPVRVKSKGTVLDRVCLMGEALKEELDGIKPEVIAVEWPQVYMKGGNNRNDLLGLAGVCGLVAGWGYLTHAYLPKEWISNLPKSKSGDPKDSPRGRYIERRLSPDELELWKTVKSHDVVDAIGIGLHHLGRMERVRVFSGAT